MRMLRLAQSGGVTCAMVAVTVLAACSAGPLHPEVEPPKPVAPVMPAASRMIEGGEGGEGGNIIELCAHLGAHVSPILTPISPELSERIEDISHMCEQALLLPRHIEAYRQCLASGRGEAACAATTLGHLGMCAYAISGTRSPWWEFVPRLTPFLPDPIGGWAGAIAKYCAGEPPLKCCTPQNGRGCHSAFNAPGFWPIYGPINCEGNFAYGPVKTAGLCLPPPSGIGCQCTHLAACSDMSVGGDPEPRILPTDDNATMDRRDALFRDLQIAFTRLLDQSSPDVDSLIIDNEEPGYTNSKVGWGYVAGEGYRQNYRIAGKGTGASQAKWEFDVVEGETYELQATWPISNYGRASNATYSVLDSDDSVLGTQTVNQALLPNGTYVDGTFFQSLGTYSSSGSKLRVVIDDNADGAVVADAIRAVGPGLSRGDPKLLQDLLAFASFRGCKRWLELTGKVDPFLDSAKLPPKFRGGFDTIYTRNLAAKAAMRVLFALPRGLARIDYVRARLWSPASTAKYLAAVADPDTELANWMSPLALRLLKDADPDYKLLAVPVAGEPAATPGAYLDACAVGSPPALSVTITPATTGADAAATINLQLQVDDPEFDADAPNGGGNATHLDPLVIDWGDGVVETQNLYALDFPDQNVITHTYGAAGTYQLHAWVLNGAGLQATDTATVVVAAGGKAPPSSISSLTLDMTAAAQGYYQGPISYSVHAVDAAGNAEPIGRRWIRLPRTHDWAGTWFWRPNVVNVGRVRFKNSSLRPVDAIRIEPQYFGSGGGEIRLSKIELETYASEGATSVRRTVSVTPGRVKMYFGASTTPVTPAAGPAGGVVLPANAREVVVDTR